MANKKVSRKRLDELEYNVYKKNAPKNGSSQQNQGEGCAPLVAIFVAAIVAAILLFVLITNKSGYASRHCARFGCSNPVASGSAYCQKHTAGSTVKILPKKKKNEEEEEEEKKKRSSIFDGSYSNKDSYSNSGSTSEGASGNTSDSGQSGAVQSKGNDTADAE